MSKTIEYTIKFDTNGNAVITGITGASDKLKKSLSGAQDIANKFGASFLKLDAIKNAINGVARAFDGVAEPGMKLSSSIADLSAVTGVAGKKLREIEGYARDSAKTFGGSAAQGVEAYKLILSQLSPEIAKTPSALADMGRSVQILSKTMGGDAVAATEVLTAAMNQYQVSTADPTAASKTMAEMMNIMAAAAKEGSAELPAIKAALENAGMAAKMANVSFAETNAAIQVLDKSGKKGAEGGVALRNVLATLSEGRFLPEKTKAALAAAGVNIAGLGDHSLTLSQRLNLLKPIMSDSALVTQLFGKENQNAALALISQTALMDQYGKAIVGTNTALEQAGIVMEAPAEKMARMQARVDNLKIGFFNLTGAAYPFINIGSQVLSTLADFAPILMVLPQLTTLWTGAQWLLNAAFLASPIGWIVLGVSALVAVIAVAWNKFEGFRAVVITVWDTIKGFGDILKNYVIDRIKGIISGVGAIGSAIYKLFTGDFSGAWAAAKQGAADLSGYSAVTNAINSGANLVGGIGRDYQLNLAAQKVSSPKSDAIAPPAIAGTAGISTAQASGGKGAGKATTEAIASGGTRNTSIVINVGKMVENIVFDGHLKERRAELEKEITQVMARVLGMAQATNG